MSMRAEKLVAISQFLSAFPKLFDYVHDRKENITVGAGKFVELLKYEDVRGLLLDATLQTTTDEMVIHFTIDTISFEVVPKELWRMGLGKEERRNFRIIRYDPDYKIFIGGFYPDPPYPITESIAVSVLNPTTEDAVVSWHIYFLKYTEELLTMIDEMMRSEEEEEGEGGGRS
ncbi:MAG: hypothetical protein J7J91_05630 [Deltaproteobacteria bacterium]|nr:hypothetical protein [Deltaproteobacteria bacterium]